jgi:histone H3/H4
MNSTTDSEILYIKSINNYEKDDEEDEIELEDSEISDVESINNYEEDENEEDEEEEDEKEEDEEEEDEKEEEEKKEKKEEDEEEEELEDYETDIDSNEPYSEYSDSEEDSDIQQLQDSLFDTGINEESETEDSEMNEDKILKEISYYQNTTHNLIPRESFKRLCDEVLQDFVADWCFTKNAIDAMQVACEAYMIETFQKSNEIAILGKRQTIQPKDMCFAKRNRTEY